MLRWKNKKETEIGKKGTKGIIKNLVITIICFSVFILMPSTVYAAEADENGFIVENGVLTGYTGTAVNVIIPNTITSIGDRVFAENKSISSITIPDGVTVIGSMAFYGCTNLEDIIIPNSVIEIKDWAFKGTKWLENKRNENPFVIVNDILVDGHGLSGDIIIPNNVRSISGRAFDYNDNLTSVDMSGNVAHIGKMAFYDCDGLTNVIMSDNVTRIEERAFLDCRNLISINISNNLKSIEEYTFNGCRKLENITLPESVESIGTFAFCICPNLTIKILNPNCNIYDAWSTIGHTDGTTGITIYGYSGSTAESYATTYGRNFLQIDDNIELNAYTAFPESTIGVNQDVKILFILYVNENKTPIKEYSLDNSNPSVLQVKECINDSDGSIIITLKGLKVGYSDLKFTDNSTGATITLSLSVEDKCNYFRCSVFPIPDTSIGSIYVADYNCTVNEKGTHDIVFNAYNTSYAYGIVEVYDENGNLKRVVPLEPRTDGSGMEKVVNGFKWVWEDIKDIFNGDTPFYVKEANAKHTPVKLENIPENAEIIITSDGNISDLVSIYTGIDVFVRTVCTASSIDLKYDGQKETVEELMEALVDSLMKSISNEETEAMIKQGLLKESAKNISTAMAFSLSADSISNIYETMYNLFQNLDIDAENIILNVLKEMGYSVADELFTTLVPHYKIVNFIDQILEIAWPLTDFSFNCDRGKIEIHVIQHGAPVTITVFCPVDIYVYDAIGNVVANVIDNTVVNAGNEDVTIAVIDDVKFITIKNEGDYTVKYIGTDTGTMDITITKKTATGETVKTFSNVELEEDKQMVSFIQEDDTSQDVRLFIVDEDQNIVGEITESGVEETPQETLILKFSGAGVTLKDNISIKFQVDASLFEEYFTDPYVTINFNNKAFTITEYETKGEVYLFEFQDIAPHQLKDTITATLYAYAAIDNGRQLCESDPIEYSVTKYCYNMLNNPNSSEKLKKVLVDLLNYGSEAQKYVNYKVDTLANADLSEEQKILPAINELELETVKNQDNAITDPSVTWEGVSLRLEDAINIRYMIAADSIDGLTAKITMGGITRTIPASKFEPVSGGYMVNFDGLHAGQLRETVEATIFCEEEQVSNTVSYSVESYAYAKLNDNNSSELLKNLLIAMMQYGDSAAAYAENNAN